MVIVALSGHLKWRRGNKRMAGQRICSTEQGMVSMVYVSDEMLQLEHDIPVLIP
jgi:hypothetical protein